MEERNEGNRDLEAIPSSLLPKISKLLGLRSHSDLQNILCPPDATEQVFSFLFFLSALFF